MNMVRLIYASRFGSRVGPNDVQDILSVSRERNKEAGITGVLCYDPRFFLQVLEGPRDKVNEPYCGIAGDRRHVGVTLLAYDDVEDRIFAEWSMAYVRMDDAAKPVWAELNLSGDFDPYTMKAEQVLGFVNRISAERQRFLDSLTGE